MPEPLWIYLMALLYFTRVSTCSTIAEAFADASHDRLTRMLQGRLVRADTPARGVAHPVHGRWRVSDPRRYRGRKALCARLGEAAWVWSSKHKKVVFGVSVVLLVWTDGQVRIPVAFRVWHKGGLSKFALALELLSYARNRLKCQPQLVLFDPGIRPRRCASGSATMAGILCASCKKNRRFDGERLAPPTSSNRIGMPWGCLPEGMKVLVVKYRRKYYATNRLSLTAKEVRQHYKIRHAVEEVIRTVKSQLGLEACQAGYRRRGAADAPAHSPGPKQHHVALCLVAYLIVERERLDRRLTWRQCKRQLILNGVQVTLPALERVRKAA